MQNLVSKLPRRLILIVSIVLLGVVLVHFAGVALLRHYAEALLHPPLPQGTRIGQVDLNLFTGALELKDFELQNDDGPRLRFGKLALKISPWQLFTGKVHVQRANLSDGFVRIDRRRDGSYDLGVPPFGDQEPTPNDTEPAAFSLAGAVLERIKIEYHDGKFFSNAHLRKIEMGAYSARAKTQEVPLSWLLSLDEREISGQARFTIDQGGVAAKGELKTGLLDLARIQRLAALDPLAEGEVAYEGSFSWQAPQLVLAGALQAPAVVYEVGDRLVSIGGGDFPDFEFKLLTAPALAAELSPRKGSHAESVEWKTSDQLATASRVRIAGKFRYEDDKLVNAEGLRFNAGSLHWQAGMQRAKLSDFALSGTLQQGIAGELRLPSADLQLSAGRAEFEDTPGTLAVAFDDFELKGLKLRPVKGEEGGNRTIECQLSIVSSRVGQADVVLQWSALTAAIDGTVGLAEASISSDLTLAELRVETPALVNGPLQIEKISTKGLLLGNESRVERLQLQGIQLPGELPETGVKVATLSFSTGSFSVGAGLDLGDIVIDGLRTGVIREKEGQWRHPGTAVTSPGPQQSGAGEQALAWRIGSLKVTGESHVTSGDRTNPAATLQRNRIDVLTVGELASARPDQDTPFEVALRPDKYTRFEIKGVARPIADPVYLDAKGKLQGLAMPRLNGYIANDLGHRFLDGQLDTRFDVKIANNKLKMENFLELHGVEAEALEGKAGPPLTTAIALLEDRDGYVKLEVPVEGQLDDPNFHVLAALNPIIMKAVAGTAALAIQPLGSVLLLGSLVADQALKVSFNPALFEAGSTQLDPETEKYLGELTGKLKEKPKLSLRICGVVAEVERQKDKKGVYLDKEEALLEMAQQRAQAVRDYMAGRGAGKKQLRSCRPRLDTKPEAKPRVDIRL